MVFSAIHFREELYHFLDLETPSTQDKCLLALSGAIPLVLNLILTIVIWVTPFDLDWTPVIESGLGYCSVSHVFDGRMVEICISLGFCL
jgi:hypothetical protein